ncbi:PREDICTED: apoptosis-inducing factor 2-like [Ipomoea nil]|uniref:apoptosis-inducing factor 2-like n=1 Tax=Ipomoea nil TaxID=35883 RepID=UPI000900D1DD|nr:PREDICTED: apoptosis-inducing factor 2-like [Ipomoea nil]
MASSTAARQRVVVVGGGVAGSIVAYSLQDHADVFLIDSKEYFEIPWASLRSIVEPAFAKRSLINHYEYLPKANIIVSSAVDIKSSQVLTAQARLIGYDYLVIATGHTYNNPCTKQDKICHYQAEHDRIRAANSVLIIGGGATGVELAAEITVDFPDKKVTLVHEGTRLVDFLREKASAKILNWLISKKVEVILGQSVDLESSIDGAYVTTGGETIAADCHFLCMGKPVGSSWLKETFLNDSLDDNGRLLVDSNLRVMRHNNVFAVGDIANTNETKQGSLAQKHAFLVAKNLKLLISGGNDDRLAAYKPSSTGLAIVSLGRREALAQIMFMSYVGRLPGLIKSGDLFVGRTRKQLGLNPDAS